MKNPLLNLELHRLRAELAHLRTDPKEMRRAAWIILGVGFALWWDVLRHVQAKPQKFLDAWHFIRFGFPVLFATGAALIGSFGRMSRWLSRWATGGWSVLPINPRSIVQWLLSSMLLMDSLWFFGALALSIALAVVARMNGLQEFPVLLLVTFLLITAAAVSKIFATLLVRTGGSQILLWPNWILRALGSILAMALFQPLTVVWIFAESLRQTGNTAMSAVVILGMAVVVGVLALCARLLLIRQWRAIGASFEIQQTQTRSHESVPLASFMARWARGPVGQFVTLYNLRSGIQLQRWGTPTNVGGRRLYMILPMFAAIASLTFGMLLMSATSKEPLPIIAPLFCGGWAGMFTIAVIPPLQPIYRLLRMMPISFGEFVRSIVTLPLILSGALVALCCIGASIADPEHAYLAFAIMWGLFLGIITLRIFIVTSFPDAQQTAEFTFMITLAVCGLAGYALHWAAGVLLFVAATIYFIRKAAREWRCREEGLSV